MNLPSDQGACVPEPKTEIEKLRERVHFLETCCVIELAVINPSVSDWMKHWEGRALKAEAMLAEPDRAADPRLVREFREADAAHTPTPDEMLEVAKSIPDTSDGVTYGLAGFVRILCRDLAASQERVRELIALNNKHYDEACQCEVKRAAVEQERDALAKDAERGRYLLSRMVHQHSGPHTGWTLDVLLPGDDPESAIDAALVSGRDAT